MKRPLIVVADDYPPAIGGTPVEQRLREIGELVLHHSFANKPELLLPRLKDAEVTINIRASTYYSREVLKECPRLKHVAIFGVGTDNVDLAACRDLGITVTNTPGYAAIGVAELAITLALAVLRHIPQNDAAVRRGEWARYPVGLLHGKTLGLVGVGAIGARAAELGKALGMKVIAWTQHPSPERARKLGVEFVELDDLFRQADVVSIHLRLLPETRGTITRRHIALMKPTAILVNTARGALLDEEALVEALREKRIAGAGLDVFVTEPLPKGHPLMQLDNVVLSPHTGAYAYETAQAGLHMSVDNIINWLAGKPTNVVA